jgi:hypothetical protein
LTGQMRDGPPRPSGDDDASSHMPSGIPHQIDGRRVAATDALQNGTGPFGLIVQRLGVPARGLRYPAAWRAGSCADREKWWRDLADWVDWLIDAYRFPPAGWTSWWTTPGACEELAALRDWHRELCDVLLVDRPPPDKARDGEALTAWHRDEKRARIERACSLASWHDALARCSVRLAGAEPKPLLQRATEATALTLKRSDDLTTDRGQRFEAWLHAHFDGST